MILFLNVQVLNGYVFEKSLIAVSKIKFNTRQNRSYFYQEQCFLIKAQLIVFYQNVSYFGHHSKNNRERIKNYGNQPQTNQHQSKWQSEN